MLRIAGAASLTLLDPAYSTPGPSNTAELSIKPVGTGPTEILILAA